MPINLPDRIAALRPHPVMGAQQFIRRWRETVASLLDDGSSATHVSLAQIYCRPIDGGWLVTTPSTDAAGHVALGVIGRGDVSFSVTFEGRAREPFDLATFDEALDFFAEYRSALELGVSPRS